MIVFNTTYHAHNEICEAFIDWLRNHYIPAALADGQLSNHRLAQVMSAEEEDKEGKSISLQFDVDHVDDLSDWYRKVGTPLLSELTSRFGNRVVGFTTLLYVID